jgi:hypothetical protein
VSFGQAAQIVEALAAPNPLFAGQPGLAFRLDAAAAGMRAVVYSQAMALVWREEPQGPFPAGWNRVELQDLWARNGTWYVELSALRPDGSASQRRLLKLVVSR